MSSCLIVVDMQNDFVDGALGFPEAGAVVNTIEAKLNEALRQGIDLYFTVDTHDETYLTSEEGKHLGVVHCVKGTHGHFVHPRLAPFLIHAKKVFEKPTFASLELANTLKSQSYDRVELCGLVSNICVLSNAVMAKSALPNARIVIDKNATASYDPALHEAALLLLQGLHVDIWEGPRLA